MNIYVLVTKFPTYTSQIQYSQFSAIYLEIDLHTSYYLMQPFILAAGGFAYD
jgi:hypothetical protein